MFLPVRAGRCRLWVGQHRAASSSDALPLLVCHGGPGVPSDYLFPLGGQLPRPVLFFDQLGCGRSERPSPEVEEYSIAASVQDLVEMVEAMVAKRLIPLQRGEPAYHLYGQSFGGILAFEALAPNSVIADWCATEPSLGCFTLPVLLLAAEHDFVTPRSMESWLHLAQRRLEIIPGAAHHALLERPEIYGACLERFLQEHESARGPMAGMD